MGNTEHAVSRNLNIPALVIAAIAVVLFIMALMQTYLHEFGARNPRGHVAKTTLNEALETVTCLGALIVGGLFVALFGMMCVAVYDLTRRFTGG